MSDRSPSLFAGVEPLEVFVELLADIDVHTSSTEFYDRICEAICRLTTMRRAAIFMADETRRRVRAVGAYGISFKELAALRPTLEQMDGFISIERFQSLADPGKILSLSFWRDDAALSQWRQVEGHRAAQTRGRAELLRDYRLRIAAVIRDYGMNDRDEAPADSRARHG